jgi:sigma-B regulation protein RsbU (phosphoserine phosphatase)
LDGLTRQERNALEDDLQLVIDVQQGLLPQRDLVYGGWRISYYYEPAGLVSGDYCDVVDTGTSGVYFMVGDVCGKGVAASIVTAHLHGMLRAMIYLGLPVHLMLERVSRALCEGNLPYATLVCGRAWPNGMVEIANAGHPLPLVVRNGTVTAIEESGLPAGIIDGEEFSSSKVSLQHGQSLVLYSDGVSEERDISGHEYGTARLRRMVGDRHAMHPSALVAACRDDLAAFREGTEKADDLTILALSRDDSNSMADAPYRPC